MTNLEANKQVVMQYVEGFNRGDFAALRDLLAIDALIYGVLGWGEIDKVIQIWQELHTGLAIKLTFEEIIAEGDTVAVRCSDGLPPVTAANLSRKTGAI